MSIGAKHPNRSVLTGGLRLVLGLSLLFVGGCQLAEPDPMASDRTRSPGATPQILAEATPSSAPTNTPPQGTLPSDTLPSDALPSDTLPSDALPSDALPSDTPPSETAPNHTPMPSSPDAPHDLADCSPDQVAAIDEVIGNQLQAFNAGDFAEALSWATPGFRRGFSPESFEAMITKDFPVPAAATAHEVLSCTVVDRLAVTTVQVRGPAGQQSLEYGLQLVTGAGWRIGGALPLGDSGADDTII